VLLVLAALQGLAWSLATAPLHGPDEPAHVAYAQLLAETGHGPKATTGTRSVSTEVARAQYEMNLAPIIGHVDARPTWSVIRSVSKTLDDVPDAQRKDGAGPNSVAQNPPLYYTYTALAYRLSPEQSLLGRLFAMRAATVALYVGTVALAWLLAGELFQRRWLQFVATAVVGLHPKLASVAGNVNPDTLLVTLSTAFLLVGARILKRGATTRRVVGLAFLTGLAALTHGRGLFLVPPAVLVLLLGVLQTHPSRAQLTRQAALATAALGVCLVGAYLWTRTTSAGGGAFGGEVGRAATQELGPRQFLAYLWHFYLPGGSFIGPQLGPPYGFRQFYIGTFFSAYANLEVTLSPGVDLWLTRMAGFGASLLAVLAVIRRRALWAQWRLVLFAVGTFFSLMALLHISSYRDLQVGGDPLITGRYLLPCIALLGIACAWAIGSLPRRVGPLAAAVLVAGLLLLDIGAFLINAQRFVG
jgi:4-amino-4-deoxy-L-arabinose transferase-like glycosyltransferase